MGHSQPKVGNDTAAVSSHQNILGLDVPMGDGGLALGAEDLGVQVDQPRDGGDQDPHRLQLSQGRPDPTDNLISCLSSILYFGFFFITGTYFITK